MLVLTIERSYYVHGTNTIKSCCVAEDITSPFPIQPGQRFVGKQSLVFLSIILRQGHKYFNVKKYIINVIHILCICLLTLVSLQATAQSLVFATLLVSVINCRDYQGTIILQRGPRQYSGYGAVLQIGRSLVRSQLVSVDFSLTYNPSGRTMVLGSTQPLTEMSTRNYPAGREGVQAAGAQG